MHAASSPRTRHSSATLTGHRSAAAPDRLDLLARMLSLRTEGVALALSGPQDNASNEQCWNDLYARAGALGRQWVAADPRNARHLLPSLLTGLSDLDDAVEAAYLDAVVAAPGSPSVDSEPL